MLWYFWTFLVLFKSLLPPIEVYPIHIDRHIFFLANRIRISTLLADKFSRENLWRCGRILTVAMMVEGGHEEVRVNFNENVPRLRRATSKNVAEEQLRDLE